VLDQKIEDPQGKFFPPRESSEGMFALAKLLRIEMRALRLTRLAEDD
jgi:hypothetical protein